MKRLLFSVLCVAYVSNTNAQASWCPAGAQWHYHVNWFAEYGFAELTYVGDTIIDGVPSKKIFEFVKTINQATGQIVTGGNFRYSYEANGVVYGRGYDWTTSIDVWDTLFNINAVPGNRWGIYPGVYDSSYMEVQDTGHAMIQGFNLRWLTVEYTINGLVEDWLLDTIYERIGFAGFNYPFEASVGSTDPFISGFCNYSDDAFSDWNNTDTVCRFLPTGIETTLAPTFSVFPNPVSDVFHFKSFDGAPATICVYSSDGRKMLEQRKFENDAIDMSTLPNGIFTIEMISHQGVSRQKIIKTSP